MCERARVCAGVFTMDGVILRCPPHHVRVSVTLTRSCHRPLRDLQDPGNDGGTAILMGQNYGGVPIDPTRGDHVPLSGYRPPVSRYRIHWFFAVVLTVLAQSRAPHSLVLQANPRSTTFHL